MPEKIVMLNVHSVTNAGDEALLQSALEQLAANFPGCLVTLSMNDPVNYHGDEPTQPSIKAWVCIFDANGRAHWKIGRLIWLLPSTVFPVLSQKWFKHPIFWLTPPGLLGTLKAILDADLVVSAPGGYLYNSGSGISMLLVMYPILLALLAGKPVYLLPQSIGPIRHWWDRLCLRWLLERVRIVMVREPLSMQLVQNYKVRNPRFRLVPDMAFTLPAAEKADGKTWLREQGIDPDEGCPLLGMTVINWGARNRQFHRQEQYESACASAARWFVGQTGGRVIFLPQVWGPTPALDDRLPSRRVVEQLQDHSGMIHLASNPLPLNTLKAVYGQMDLFIGTRMHSNIFALSEGVPVIAIGYQHKTQGIALMAGIGEWVIDIEQVDDKILVDYLQALWSSRESWREQIRHTIPELILQAGQAGGMIRRDYTRISDKLPHG